MIYRYMKPGEETYVSKLISRVLNRYVAPNYSQEGIKEFESYIIPDLITDRTRSDHFVLVAELEGNLVGAIEVRSLSHVSLLFVDSDYQRSGIGNVLLSKSLEICRDSRPDVSAVTVHASPNAVEAYLKYGFETQGPEQIENGIRFVPMVLNVARDST